MNKRDYIITIASSFIGCNENDGTHKQIIDVYNAQENLPRNYRMSYTDAWCAGFVSAVGILAGCEDVIPMECSCQLMIDKAEEMGIYHSGNMYVPDKADIIMYDWDDNGRADHEGFVEYVDGNKVHVIEGNKSDSVATRTISIGEPTIRGYITPEYSIYEHGKTYMQIASEVLTGAWGNGKARKEAIEKAGYNYEAVRTLVNGIILNPDEFNIAKMIKESECDIDLIVTLWSLI